MAFFVTSTTPVRTEVFPLLIFLGIGAMTDFQPLLENPRSFSSEPRANWYLSDSTAGFGARL
jgi:Na+-transporting methylmalonyl-CoA/oxaloacetate decarboxylase beta subunit